jgi:hypothetical protein
MHSAWSRWFLGAWAAVTVLWLVVASLLLVQTWPEPRFAVDRGTVIGSATDGSAKTMTAQGSARASPAVREHIVKFLLFAVLPPGLLLAFVLAGLKVAGLPLPSWRRQAEDMPADFPLGRHHGHRR